LRVLVKGVEEMMRLTFKFFDGRKRCCRDIIDEETGKEVGHIMSNGVGFNNYGGIDITLFGGKYRYTAERYDECWGFVKGVETVLNHVISTDRRAVQAPESITA
jgi:hypothetical protein